MEPVNPIDYLPDEILVKIFSFFSRDWRIGCLQRVCVRWREIIILEDGHYSIDETQSDTNVLDTLQNSYQLRALSLHKTINLTLWKEIAVTCQNLTKLEIYEDQENLANILKLVITLCDITSLTLPCSFLCNKENSSLVANLKNLVTFCIVGKASFGNVDLSDILYSCDNLHNIYLGYSTLCRKDLLSLEKNQDVTSLSVLFLFGATCCAQLLKAFSNTLQELCILECNCPVGDTRVLEVFNAVKDLSKLTVLRLDRLCGECPNVIVNVFQYGSLAHLKKLEFLQSRGMINDEVLTAISRNCPLLEELHFDLGDYHSLISDLGFKEFYHLSRLKKFTMLGVALSVSVKTAYYINRCIHLKQLWVTDAPWTYNINPAIIVYRIKYATYQELLRGKFNRFYDAWWGDQGRISDYYYKQKYCCI